MWQGWGMRGSVRPQTHGLGTICPSGYGQGGAGEAVVGCGLVAASYPFWESGKEECLGERKSRIRASKLL